MSSSRFKIRGLKILMVAVLAVLMMPAIGSIAPLYVLLNKIKIGPGMADTLRNSLYGVGLAIVSGALPFAIWNLKGYLDTIPRDLEEAARIDGASVNQTFIRIILPLATPALAVTAFLGFLVGWTEFAMSWQFLSKVENFTLSMALWNMTGQYSGQVPWSNFRGDGAAGSVARLDRLPRLAEVHRRRSDDRRCQGIDLQPASRRP